MTTRTMKRRYGKNVFFKSKYFFIMLVLLSIGIGAFFYYTTQPQLLQSPLAYRQRSSPTPKHHKRSLRGVVAKPVLPFATKASWVQDFSKQNGALDLHAWQFELGNSDGWGNNELEYYTDRLDNARVENGQLLINAKKENYKGSSYTSARLTTQGNLDFLYGKLEVIAKLPTGAGTWPAIWLLPTDAKYALTSGAASQRDDNWLRDGEIDMVEAVGAEPGLINASAHSFTYNPDNGNERTGNIEVSDSNTAFHTYIMEWTPTSLKFTVDGKPYYSLIKKAGDNYLAWPYDQRYHLLMNLAIGGDWGGELTDKYPPNGIDDNSGPWQLAVKSVNYYPYTGQ